MLHLVSTHAHIISYAAWLGITCYPYFRTVGFLRKWIRWPIGFNTILYKDHNTYLTFTDFEAISPLYWWANILPIPPPRHISTYYIYILSKNYNTNITKIFETSKYFYYFLQFFVPIVGFEPTPSRILTGDFCVFQDLLTAFQTLVDIILTRQ